MSISKKEHFLAEVSQSGPFYSNVIAVIDSGFAIQCVWVEQVAALAGTITLQATINGVTFNDVKDSAGNVVQLTMAGSGSDIMNGWDQNYEQIRLYVNITGGTGSVSAWISSKYN